MVVPYRLSREAAVTYGGVEWESSPLAIESLSVNSIGLGGCRMLSASGTIRVKRLLPATRLVLTC